MTNEIAEMLMKNDASLSFEEAWRRASYLVAGVQSEIDDVNGE